MAARSGTPLAAHRGPASAEKTRTARPDGEPPKPPLYHGFFHVLLDVADFLLNLADITQKPPITAPPDDSMRGTDPTIRSDRVAFVRTTREPFSESRDSIVVPRAAKTFRNHGLHGLRDVELHL